MDWPASGKAPGPLCATRRRAHPFPIVPMRVLHFYKTYYPDSVGGIEQVIRQLCVGTGRLGVTNPVLSLLREQNLVPISFEGHTVHRVPLDFELASNAC